MASPSSVGQHHSVGGTGAQCSLQRAEGLTDEWCVCGDHEHHVTRNMGEARRHRRQRTSTDGLFDATQRFAGQNSGQVGPNADDALSIGHGFEHMLQQRPTSQFDERFVAGRCPANSRTLAPCHHDCIEQQTHAPIIADRMADCCSSGITVGALSQHLPGRETRNQ